MSVATIVAKSRNYTSPLALAPHERQVDIYKLAAMGVADCRRMWNDFAREDPAMARIVAEDAESDRQKAAKATQEVDRRLRQAEKLLTKSKPKLTKAQKKVIKSQNADRPTRTATGVQWPDSGKLPRLVEMIAERLVATSDNPLEREMARKMLGR